MKFQTGMLIAVWLIATGLAAQSDQPSTASKTLWPGTAAAGSCTRSEQQDLVNKCHDAAKCAVLVCRRNGQFGSLSQQIDATPYRGKRVRFRAQVRVENADGNTIGLWMRVDRPEDGVGFFDNMGNRPITSAEWKSYEIVGEIEADAVKLNYGVLGAGDPTVWFAGPSLEILGDVPPAEAARPLTDRGLQNLMAFARLAGYVRYFYPGDQAATANWEDFLVANIDSVEAATGSEDLARKLQSLFQPIAPAIRIFTVGKVPQPVYDAAAVEALSHEDSLKVVRWKHLGFGLGGSRSYASRREYQPAAFGKTSEGFADPLQPMRIELPGGVICSLPLTLYATEKGTWPYVTPTGAGTQGTGHPASGDDRAVRLAGTMLAWNVIEHFYPYLDIVKSGWPAILRSSLLEAASDKDGRAYFTTLEKMSVALHDGHSHVSKSTYSRRFFAPVRWSLVEGKVVVTQNGGLPGLSPGDELLKINGRRALDVLAEAEALVSSPTPQWAQWWALMELTSCPSKQTLEIETQPYGKDPAPLRTQLMCDLPIPPEDRPRDKVKEIEPGIFYVDLDQLTDSGYLEMQPRLEHATAIIYDMRGYPEDGRAVRQAFSHWSTTPLKSAPFLMPVITQPDQAGVTFEDMAWPITPAEPYLAARKIFLVDGRCISQAETWAAIVEGFHLGKIVGEPTAGTNGDINSVTLPGGYSISFTGLKVLKHDGSRHHGVGIRPDIVVHQTQAGVAAGRDETVESAVRELKKEVAGSKGAN